MSVVVAYAYHSELALREQLAALRAGTDWAWQERDSEFWGDYLSARAAPEGLMVKIFVEDDGYLLEFKCLTPEAEARWEEHTRVALRQLAPLVRAQAVHQTEPNN
jgi:hypothetical protein